MKNLFVLPIVALGLLLGSQSVYALDSVSNESEETIVIQEKYIDLAVENLPQSVLDAVARDFKGYTISSAAAKEDASEFKLELSSSDGTTAEVFCDADGNWISKDE